MTNALARLARAVHLDCERIGEGYCVSGGARSHVVSADGLTCDCYDHALRGAVCKHIMAVRLQMGDAETLRALRGVVPNPGRPRAPAGATA